MKLMGIDVFQVLRNYTETRLWNFYHRLFLNLSVCVTLASHQFHYIKI